MKKFIAILLTLGMTAGLLCSCSANEDAEVTTTEAQAEVQAEAKTVKPLPGSFSDVSNGSFDVNVGFEKGAFYDEDGLKLKADVYDYEKFDLVDISQLAIGDTIVICGKEVQVESVEKTDSGYICVNGGLEKGGFDFGTDESGVYFETFMDGHKNYQKIDTVVFDVADEFVFTDDSDLENTGITYSVTDLMAEGSAVEYNFIPQNTVIHVEDGVVINMNRRYIP